MPNPLVIRLRYVVKVPYHRRTALSRRAVFARDEHRCQYCGDHADSIDHVMPRSPRRRTSGRTSPPRAGRATCASATARPTRPACASPASGARPRSWHGSPCRSAACPRRGSRTSPRRRSVRADGLAHRDRARARPVTFHQRDLPDPVGPSVWCSHVDAPALVLGSTQPDCADRPRRVCAGADVEVVATTQRRRSGVDDAGRRDVGRRDTPRRAIPWDDDVGQSAWWLGEAWARALATVGIGIGTAAARVHRGAMVRTPWSGARVLRRRRPRRGDARWAQRWSASASAGTRAERGSSARVAPPLGRGGTRRLLSPPPAHRLTICATSRSSSLRRKPTCTPRFQAALRTDAAKPF